MGTPHVSRMSPACTYTSYYSNLRILNHLTTAIVERCRDLENEARDTYDAYLRCCFSDASQLDMTGSGNDCSPVAARESRWAKAQVKIVRMSFERAKLPKDPNRPTRIDASLCSPDATTDVGDDLVTVAVVSNASFLLGVYSEVYSGVYSEVYFGLL